MHRYHSVFGRFLVLRLPSIAFLLLPFLTLPGCSKHVKVVVDSITAPEAAANKEYVLLQGNSEERRDDLLFQELSKPVHDALANKGFTQVGSIAEANAALFLSFGIGPPRTTPYVGTIYVGGQPHFYSGTSTNYTRYFILTGYQAEEIRRNPREAKRVWRTVVTSTGSRGDLRVVFPAMVRAAAPYIAENPGKQIEVLMSLTGGAIENKPTTSTRRSGRRR